MCMYQSLSLSLPLSIYICKNGLDPSRSDRMEFRKERFVNLKICACDRKYAKCRTKADAHDKMGFQYISISVYIVRIQRGDRGSGPPPPLLKNHKNIEFLSNTGPDPLEFSKLSSQHSTLGHHRHASETPFKGVSLAGRWPAFSDIWILSPLKKKKKRQSSDPDQIRMEFRKEYYVDMRSQACKASILSNIRLCRAKADAHEKHLHVSFSAPIHDIFRDYKRFVCKR